MLIDFTEPFKQNKLKKRKINMEFLASTTHGKIQ